MSIFKVLNIPIYQSQVMISLGQTDKQFAMRASKYLPERDEALHNFDDENRERGKSIMYGNNMVMRLNSVPDTNGEFGSLQHEIFHIVTFIMDAKGLKFSFDSDEAYAYLIGYLTEKIYDLI